MTFPKKMDAIAPPDGSMDAANGVQAASPPGRRRLPALDGLRGTAILAVLICHYSALLPRTYGLAGFLQVGTHGVDLFFVLSGFLITGILFDAKGKEHYFRDFYVRRALRIFPLYYAALLVTVVLLPAIGGAIGAEFGPAAAAQGWLWLYGA